MCVYIAICTKLMFVCLFFLLAFFFLGFNWSDLKMICTYLLCCYRDSFLVIDASYIMVFCVIILVCMN